MLAEPWERGGVCAVGTERSPTLAHLRCSWLRELDLGFHEEASQDLLGVGESLFPWHVIVCSETEERCEMFGKGRGQSTGGL